MSRALAALFLVPLLAAFPPAAQAGHARFCPAAIDPLTCFRASGATLLATIDGCPPDALDSKLTLNCVTAALSANKREAKDCLKQLCPSGTVCIAGTTCGPKP